MSRPKIDPVSQRELALALRYHIDMAQIRGAQHHDLIRALLAANPTAFRSRHVQHNLGVQRLRWLEEEGFTAAVGSKPVAGPVPEPVEGHVG